MSAARHCETCGRPLDPSWPECPYCRTEEVSGDPDATRMSSGNPKRPSMGSSRRGPDDPTVSSPRGGPRPSPSRRAGPRPEDPTRRSRRPVRDLEDDGTVIAEHKPGLLGLLWEKEGKRLGSVYPLNEQATDIGRVAGNDIVLYDPKVSEQHARIKLSEEDEEKQYVIWDLASTNGVFVNGQKIDSATPLQENDEIKVGDTVVVLKLLDT